MYETLAGWIKGTASLVEKGRGCYTESDNGFDFRISTADYVILLDLELVLFKDHSGGFEWE